MKLVWFRRDLRTIDHTALNAAIRSGEPVCAIFVATPEQWRQHDMAPIQADLIARRLPVIRDELRQLNVPLYYREVCDFAASVEIVVALARQLRADTVLVNIEYELNEQRRDQQLKQCLQQQGIAYQAYHDKCVFSPGQVLTKQGEFFKVFTPFRKAWQAQFIVPTVVAPSPVASAPSHHEPTLKNVGEYFSYPRESSHAWPVTSHEIRDRLRAFCRERVDAYDQQRDFPALSATSGLSPYLAIGALSVRQCLARLYQSSEHGRLSAGAESWLNELIWREFYQHLIYFQPSLCQGKSFHPWGEQLHWHDASESLVRWQQGMTGYPFVDAAMRQLNQTGWMHNRLRMVVASFLTKDLHLDWREGERYFMSRLIDGDFAANNGGWQWSASTGCDGQPYFRIFNPVSQGKKFDPEGAFVREWVPELESVSNKWIHEPWRDPSVNYLSYPQPIVDHQVERKLTLSLYQKAKDNCCHDS
ncbi:deoxyribodipyrimidine photo-lyase [Vibrio gazogenes]|uniref:Deoxyribodipyrimidine photo-lyase n=1 Tax=Vibrio gazogenes DSM 21264 = NBRC 103151 TaxID=1123492 RepID=A0A1M4T693_VIBGA|nr:deoxyribodipyrimidine photo-lyase [Vibrio gazogenes]USP16029.1 deoxyribodipyrimidine photo-lyase [Vibrio gazogenes]SHE39828.1 deoxyribodipyrimidine photo-lyase [Vibrio gazogenes DSM 21264] [Vibrio gazogenes DSM 21264 = NBRC 103151]